MKKSRLHITWAKGLGEIYCHHASLFIPYTLLIPKIVHVGVTIRTNIIDDKKIINYFDRSSAFYLPCESTEGGIIIPLNSPIIIDGISLNLWTKLKEGERGTLKAFPINMFYKIREEPKVFLPFNHEKEKTPYLISESDFVNMKDGDKINATINFN